MNKTIAIVNKAISTSSEQEAISCLKLLRQRKTLVAETPTAKANETRYAGGTAKEWYDSYKKARDTARVNYQYVELYQNELVKLRKALAEAETRYKNSLKAMRSAITWGVLVLIPATVVLIMSI